MKLKGSDAAYGCEEKHLHTHTHTHTRTHTHKHTHTHTHILCIYVSMYPCIYVSILLVPEKHR